MMRNWGKTYLGTAFLEPLGLKQLLDDAADAFKEAKTVEERALVVSHHRREIRRAVPAKLVVHLSWAWALHGIISITDGAVLYLAALWYLFVEYLRK
jgi:hypothetical protein